MNLTHQLLPVADMRTINTVCPARSMGCRCGALMLVTILLLALQRSDLCFGSVYTNYVVVATVGHAGITGILGGPSINNNGLCEFAAQVSGGETIYAGNGSGDPTNLTTFISVNRSFSPYLQINDAGMTVHPTLYTAQMPRDNSVGRNCWGLCR